ncbi:uncharacterized protein [Phyllobates terribilis]|uniref:uncharacterized protein n=1 Tax=Phyllobates terribilis TaxID=111132 RepID=UPI003CCAB6E5
MLRNTVSRWIIRCWATSVLGRRPPRTPPHNSGSACARGFIVSTSQATWTTRGKQEQLRSNSTKQNMSKIIQFLYSIFKRKKDNLPTEAVHIEKKKDSPVQLHHDEKTRKPLPEATLEECYETIEDTTAETIDTPVGKHETVKTIIVDKKQAVYFHINKSELEAKEDKLLGILKCKVQPADVKPPLMIAQEQAVEINQKPTESQNEQISRDSLLLNSIGEDPETQLDQVNDIIKKTGKTASVKSTKGTQDPVNLLGGKEMTTSMEQMKAARTTSSQSPDKTLSEQRILYQKASAKRGVLNKSTREEKWWEVSEGKNYRLMGHKAPGEQKILAQLPTEMLQTTKNIQYDVSPEILNFKKIVSDVYLNSDLFEGKHFAFIVVGVLIKKYVMLYGYMKPLLK